jgi:pimeloyl-ACP methyl ester carboxylesterase
MAGRRIRWVIKVERAALVGISQGAWTSLKFATAMPHRVEKLVLIAPGGVVPDRVSFIFYAISMSLMGKRGIRRLSRAMFGDQQVPDGVEDIVVEMSSHFKPRMGVLPIFTDDALRRLTMPTLLLGGTKDIMRDLHKIEARLRQYLPNLRVNIIPGGGHALLHTSGCVLEFLLR